MIPKIIHYCWFGRGEMPQLVLDCMASWHKYMPDWEYMVWNEDNFDIEANQYVRDAYESRKFAFVSDCARLYALQKFGGVYLDTDVEVLKPLDDLLDYEAFIGYEGSKHTPLGTSTIGSVPEGIWVGRQLKRYDNRCFLDGNGSMDLTTNVTFITQDMIERGLVCDGAECDFDGIHIFPVEYFCPRQTTGEYFYSKNTYCDHKGLASWESGRHIPMLLRLVGPKTKIKLIKLKRRLIG